MLDRFSSREEVEFYPEIYEEGMAARFDGKRLNDNPYSSGTWSCSSWGAGWADADIQLLQEEAPDGPVL